jgi:hypothetical protein
VHAPTSLNPDNWKVRKLDDAPGTDVKSRIKLLEKWSRKGGVLLITPDMFKRLCDPTKQHNDENARLLVTLLLDPGPDLLIVDEGHIYLTSSSSSSSSKGAKDQQTQVLSTLYKVTVVGLFFAAHVIQPSAAHLSHEQRCCDDGRGLGARGV